MGLNRYWYCRRFWLRRISIRILGGLTQLFGTFNRRELVFVGLPQRMENIAYERHRVGSVLNNRQCQTPVMEFGLVQVRRSQQSDADNISSCRVEFMAHLA